MSWYSGPVIQADSYLGSSTTAYMRPLFPAVVAFQSIASSKSVYSSSVVRSIREWLP